MPQKTKSLLYLSCFIIAAILYYNTDNTSATSSQNDEIVDTHNTHITDNTSTTSSQNDETVDTHNTHIDEITISSFDDDEVEESEEEEGKEYSD